jgi:predicted ATPase
VPVHAFRVIGRRAAPGPKRGLASVGLESPMVGRDGALEALAGLMPIVRGGRGRVAFLLGEPGIGKSRLLAELRRRLDAEASPEAPAPRWVEARCVSYGRNLPYHLLIDLVRSTLGIGPSATEAEAREILDRELAIIVGDESVDVTPYFAHLLALPLRPGEVDRTKTDPTVMQGRFVAATLRLLRGLTATGPIVLVCEDLHWADPASVEVVRQVLPLATEMPVLFLGAMRPETDAPGWQLVTEGRQVFGEALTEVRLEPLTDDESRELVGHLLAIESLPSSVRSLILGRAEGNPFFVEEVVRMLIDGGVIELRGDRWTATEAISSIEIPETLHGLLLARIDQLPEAAKRSLRIAAVIGRQFPVRVLEQVLGSGME